MEKKVSKAKSNKKGTASAKKTTTSKKVTPTNKSVKTEVKKDTSLKSEVIVKEEKVKTPEQEPDFGGNEIRKLLIIIGAVCAVMLSFYFITEFVIKNKKDKEETKKEDKTVVIQYEQIMMGELLRQNENDYYVLAFVEDDPMLSVYTNYMKLYNEKEGHAKIYKANLNDSFNKDYVAETSYLTGTDITKIKVTGTTLIRVQNSAVLTSYEGYDRISGKFQRLID